MPTVAAFRLLPSVAQGIDEDPAESAGDAQQKHEGLDSQAQELAPQCRTSPLHNQGEEEEGVEVPTWFMSLAQSGRTLLLRLPSQRSDSP